MQTRHGYIYKYIVKFKLIMKFLLVCFCLGFIFAMVFACKLVVDWTSMVSCIEVFTFESAYQKKHAIYCGH